MAITKEQLLKQATEGTGDNLRSAVRTSLPLQLQNSEEQRQKRAKEIADRSTDKINDPIAYEAQGWKMGENKRSDFNVTDKPLAMRTSVPEGAKPESLPKLSMQEIIEKIKPQQEREAQKIKDEEQRRKEKRYKTEQILNAVGDGIYALSDIFFANSSGLSWAKGAESATAARKANWDKMLSDEKENSFRAYQLGQKDRDFNYKVERDKIQDAKDAEKAARDKAKDERDKAKADMDAELAKLDKLIKEGKVTEQQAKALEAGIKAKHADALAKAKVGTEKAKVGTEKAKAGYWNRRDGKGGSGSGSKDKFITLSDGKGTHYNIDEQVWKGSAEQVYKALKKAGIQGPIKASIGGISGQEIRTFVQEYWDEVPEVREIVKYLSTIDPDNPKSKGNGGNSQPKKYVPPEEKAQNGGQPIKEVDFVP